MDESLLQGIKERMETLNEAEPDFDKLLISSQQFPTAAWLQGR